MGAEFEEAVRFYKVDDDGWNWRAKWNGYVLSSNHRDATRAEAFADFEATVAVFCRLFGDRGEEIE